MAKLITHFTKSDKNKLDKMIKENQDYDFPSIDEVLDYLSSTDDDEMSENVMGDLIIQYIEEEGIMFDVC